MIDLEVLDNVINILSILPAENPLEEVILQALKEYKKIRLEPKRYWREEENETK